MLIHNLYTRIGNRIPYKQTTTMQQGPLKIDLTGIIRSRVKGVKGKLIPGFMLKGLENLICQDELNNLLDKLYPLQGSDFAEGLYRELNIDIEVEGLENIPQDGRFVFASNHPLGGLDGIGLIKILGKKYGDEGVRFIVNDMLLNVEPLRNVFLPVNKYGSQARQASLVMNEAYASDRQIVMFPAGLVSRLSDVGEIRDLEWQKSFVVKAMESGRKIIPVRFEAKNRMRFYRTARWRKKIGLKVNVEQALLPGELVAANGNKYRVIFGKPVDPVELKNQGLNPRQIAARIRWMSDVLSEN